ncbi:MAG: FAD-dependent monooxygenase [Pseudomonadales bacterium]|nr:FAD-dependent monooxygenase [Pseudomonadales bacterium]
MTASERYDIVIVGGGMVGSMLAALMVQSSIRIAVIESVTPKAFDPDSLPDLRVSAFSPASKKMFEQVGAWSNIEAMRHCPYAHMRVWEEPENLLVKKLLSGHGNETHFKAEEVGQSALGYIVENRILQLALQQVLEQSSNVDLLMPEELQNLERQGDEVQLYLKSGKQLTASLVVGADGAISQVRKAINIGVRSLDYPQHALMALMQMDGPQQDVTWQHFTPTGPQSFLPLPDVNGQSYGAAVWYHTPDQIQKLQKMPLDEFQDQLLDTFPERLEGVQKVMAKGSFPLTRRHAHNYVKPGFALVGDAAHTIHPLAGQGVNIGMQDVAMLAEQLLKAQDANEPLGSINVLKIYEKKRIQENRKMICAMEFFYRTFSNDSAPAALIRTLGLGIAERAGPLKKQVIRYAMGL